MWLFESEWPGNEWAVSVYKYIEEYIMPLETFYFDMEIFNKEAL